MFNIPNEYPYKSITYIASCFEAFDFLEISHQSTSLLVYRVWHQRPELGQFASIEAQLLFFFGRFSITRAIV